METYIINKLNRIHSANIIMNNSRNLLYYFHPKLDEEYILVKMLGHGRQGVVLHLKNRTTNISYALKVVPLNKNNSSIDLFKKEVEFMCLAQTENISVTIHRIEEKFYHINKDETCGFFLMDKVDFTLEDIYYNKVLTKRDIKQIFNRVI